MGRESEPTNKNQPTSREQAVRRHWMESLNELWSLSNLPDAAVSIGAGIGKGRCPFWSRFLPSYGRPQFFSPRCFNVKSESAGKKQWGKSPRFASSIGTGAVTELLHPRVAASEIRRRLRATSRARPLFDFSPCAADSALTGMLNGLVGLFRDES